MDLRDFKEQVFEAGRSIGLEDMEVYVSRSKNFSVQIYQKEVDDYTVSVTEGVGFRARFDGKVGYAYVETMDQDSVKLLVEGAKSNAQIIDSPDEIVFFAGSAEYPQVSAYSDKLEKVSPEEKIEFAKALEEEALAADPRVSMVMRAVTAYGENEVYIANTKGLERSYNRNSAAAYVAAMVREGEQVKTGGRMVQGNDWRKFNAKEMAEQAVEEGVSLLTAETVKSGNYRILLRYDVARQLLATFSSVFSAEAVQKGLSLLGDKLGQEIAVSELNLIDDPLLPDGGASAPFDGEGVATKTKKVIKNGTLNTFLHNLKTAQKDGVESTGNAYRASFRSTVGISPSNFYIEPGAKGYEQLIKELDNGLIIISVQGTHSGANSVSGDFSLGAYGYLVENGEIVRAVDQITIAGNFFEVLKSVEEIGSDLEFSSGGGASIGAPSLLLSNLAVAGN